MKADCNQMNAKAPNGADEKTARLYEAFGAICVDIHDIYRIDCETEHVTVLRQSEHTQTLRDLLPKTYTYTEAMNAYIRTNVFSQDRISMQKQLSLAHVCEVLREEENLYFFYRVIIGGELHNYRARCIRLGDPETFREFVLLFVPEDFETSQTQVIRTLEMDEVTGAYTKQAFYHHAEEILDKNPDKNYDIIVTDVENFKMVNQVYGHSTGDKLLRFLAECYVNAARNGLCARYGADQFVILSEAMRDDAVALFAKLAKSLPEKAPVPHLCVRYGINRRVDRADSIADMCDKAVLAMRSHKSFRDSPLAFYDQDVIQKHFRAQLVESNFERALEEKEFVVWCQPKYNAFTKRMTSAEALVRWKNADGSFTPPGEFIPIFEADGLIVRLDEYVFRYVCERQKALLNAGTEPLPISVNLSRATLFRPQTVARYCEIIEEVGVPKTLVPLELTESATVDTLQIGSLIDAMREAGFTLHMDDFGSGYSSLSSLSTLHFDVVKLDKSLIDGIGNTRGDETLRHIIELAHFFEMEVVAEGVEEASQLNFLKKLSCDTIQGYLFSKPVPFDDYLKQSAAQPISVSETLDSDLLAEEASIGSLRITNDAKMQVLSSLASIYMTMHVIDLKEDSVVEFATTTNVKEHANRAHNAKGQMTAAMTATVAPDYLPAVLEFVDLDTLPARMKGKRTIAGEFVGTHFGWFEARFTTVTFNANEEPEKVIYTTKVIEADRRKEDKVEACLTDELTGVGNLAAFEQKIRALADPKNHQEKDTPELTVLVVDVNHVKATNDALGHAAGDELIWGTADILNTLLSKENGTIYRLGGDRFAALFYADAEKLETLRLDFEAAVRGWIGNEVRSLSTTLGVVTRRELPELSVADLVNEADRRRLAQKGKETKL